MVENKIKNKNKTNFIVHLHAPKPNSVLVTGNL